MHGRTEVLNNALCEAVLVIFECLLEEELCSLPTPPHGANAWLYREGYIIAEIAPKPLSPKDVVELAGRQMDCKMWVFGVGWNSTIVNLVAGKLRFALGIVNAEGKV